MRDGKGVLFLGEGADFVTEVGHGVVADLLHADVVDSGGRLCRAKARRRVASAAWKRHRHRQHGHSVAVSATARQGGRAPRRVSPMLAQRH